jgi:hypothetical protein
MNNQSALVFGFQLLLVSNSFYISVYYFLARLIQ